MGRLSKDKRDIYYREAKRQGFRARSAFKLLQIDEELDLLHGVRNVVDLCAAPGGWSQVLAMRIMGAAGDLEAGGRGGEGQSEPRIVAVDNFEMEPIAGVVQVQGDITHASTVQSVLSNFAGERADLVVCDGAPDVTGRSDFDEHVQHQLLLSALLLATALLRPGGAFLAKVFRGPRAGEVYARLRQDFRDVACCKPRASRNSSLEAFVLCRDFLAPRDVGPSGLLYSPARHEELADLGAGRPAVSVPFIACGGRDSLDADTNYPTDKDHQVLDPVAPPIRAPYQEAIEERRTAKRPLVTRVGTAEGDGDGAAPATS